MQFVDQSQLVTRDARNRQMLAMDHGRSRQSQNHSPKNPACLKSPVRRVVDTVNNRGRAPQLRTIVTGVHVVLLKQFVKSLARHSRLPCGAGDIAFVIAKEAN